VEFAWLERKKRGSWFKEEESVYWRIRKKGLGGRQREAEEKEEEWGRIARKKSDL